MLKRVFLREVRLKKVSSAFQHYAEDYLFLFTNNYTSLKNKVHSQSAIPSKIIWVCVPTEISGGGSRTISRFIKYFDRAGIRQEVLIYTPNNLVDLNHQKYVWVSGFGVPAHIEIKLYSERLNTNDFVFATAYQTAIPAIKISNPNRLGYFVQDDETTFDLSLSQQMLVLKGFERFSFAICAGDWLKTLSESRGIRHSVSFNFGVDQIYFENIKPKEKLIVGYFQPDKSRRCAEILVTALAIAKRELPSWKFVLVGGGEKGTVLPGLYNYGALNPLELASIYRRAKVGLVISATNASLTPYELIACGATVITNDGLGNDWLTKYPGLNFVGLDPIELANAIVASAKSEISRDTIDIPDWFEQIQRVIYSLKSLDCEFAKFLKNYV